MTTLLVCSVLGLLSFADAWGWGGYYGNDGKDSDDYWGGGGGYYYYDGGYYGQYYGYYSGGYYGGGYYGSGYYYYDGYYGGYYYYDDGYYYYSWGGYYYYNNYYDYVSSGSCKNACGSQGSDCYCDDYCLTYNDCCDDYLDYCADTVSSESCAGMCGDDTGMQGCYCDNLCDDYGDCCDDYESLCYTDEGCSVIDQVGWFYDSDTWETFWYGIGWYGWDTWNGNWVYDYGIWNYGWYDEVDCTFVDSFTFVGTGYCRGDDMDDQGTYETLYVDALEICGAQCILDDDCMGIEWREEGACELHYGWVPTQTKSGNVDAECWAKTEFVETEQCNYFEYGWFFTGQFWEEFDQAYGWIGMDTWNGMPVYDWGSWNLGWHMASSMCDTGSSSSGKDVSIHVTATETSKGVYEISYESTAEIEGFEVENCDLSDAYGGDAEDKGFYITTGSSSGIVIAFSFEGESITAGSGTLLTLEGSMDDECYFIFSDDDGHELSYDLEIVECTSNKC